MVKVKRGDLMEATTALEALSKVYVPMEQEHYWFIKALDVLQRTRKQISNGYNDLNNILVKTLGEKMPDGRYGISENQVEKRIEYEAKMEAYKDEEITIDNIKPLSYSDLTGLSVSLTAGDQIKLMWLFSE